MGVFCVSSFAFVECIDSCPRIGSRGSVDTATQGLRLVSIGYTYFGYLGILPWFPGIVNW